MDGIAVALKWVDLRPEVDPLTGAASFDRRTAGASDADRAALETALVLGEAWGQSVTALTVGPAGADAVLRTALSAGAGRAVRVEAPQQTPSAVVAAALAGAVRRVGTGLLVCGDWSLDRGSGSVPPLTAARLRWPQACGLVRVTATGPWRFRAERRLDRGARELLEGRGAAVLSVEGSAARLRREPLAGVIAAAAASIEVLACATEGSGAGRVHPFRPRPRVLRGPDPSLPARQRILSLTGALSARRPPQRLVLDPAAAAEQILTTLADWGAR